MTQIIEYYKQNPTLFTVTLIVLGVALVAIILIALLRHYVLKKREHKAEVEKATAALAVLPHSDTENNLFLDPKLNEETKIENAKAEMLLEDLNDDKKDDDEIPKNAENVESSAKDKNSQNSVGVEKDKNGKKDNAIDKKADNKSDENKQKNGDKDSLDKKEKTEITTDNNDKKSAYKPENAKNSNVNGSIENKTATKNSDKKIDKDADKITDKKIEQSTEKTTEKKIDKTADKKVEQNSDKKVEQNSESASNTDKAEQSVQPFEKQKYYPKRNPSAEKAQKPAAKYSGKWLIYSENGKYAANLVASNGEVLLRTEPYTALSGIKSGIETIKNNIAKDNFAISVDKNGNYFFKLYSSATRLLCVSEGYSTKAVLESTIESVKRFSKTAVIEIKKDETDSQKN